MIRKGRLMDRCMTTLSTQMNYNDNLFFPLLAAYDYDDSSRSFLTFRFYIVLNFEITLWLF